MEKNIMKSESQKIAEFLVEFARVNGVSFTVLLQTAGISGGTVSNWRGGKAKVTQLMRDRLVDKWPGLRVHLPVNLDGVVLLHDVQITHESKSPKSNGVAHTPSPKAIFSFGDMLKFMEFTKKETELVSVLIAIDEWAQENDMTLAEVLEKLKA